MKTAKYVIVAMGLVLLLSSCFMSNPWQAGGEGDSVYLPPDVIKDTTRSGSEPFQFETLLPVALNLEIDFYELSTQDSDPKGLAEIDAIAGQAVVVITNSNGDIVYEGAVQADGRLAAQMVLPAAPEDMTLTVKAKGFQERSVKISDLVKYSKIDRKMGLMSEGLSAKDIGPSETWDRDGDLVPDVYDAFPDDADYAFSLRYPSKEDEYLTVAYEDLYLETEAGDADYNDFLVKYEIFEKIGYDKELGKNMLKEIRVEATAGVKIAGYNHLFGIAFGYITEEMEEDFGGTFTLTYVDSDGIERVVDHTGFYNAGGLVEVTPTADSPFNYKAVMPMFASTNAATSGPNNKAVLEVVLENPGIERDRVQLPPYDPFLYVWNTHHDIHLIGEQPLPSIPELPGIDPIMGPVGPDPTIPVETYYLDEVGFPWALLVPVDWEHPPETVRIEKVYPFFDLWRESKGADNTDWYLWYLPNMDPNNEPPGAPALDPESLEFDRTDRTPQEAKVNITLGTDPDGNDPVTLDWTDPPAYVVVEQNDEGPESHKVIVDFPDEPSFAPPEELNIHFWCQDTEGAPSEFVPLKLSFVEGKKTSFLVIETFNPNPTIYALNDTYLTLFTVQRDANNNVVGSTVIAEDDNGNPDQVNHTGCSRIILTEELAPGSYYIKVHNPTGLGNPYYVIRVYEGNPVNTFPIVDPNKDEDDNDTVIYDAAENLLIPVNPQLIAFDELVPRSIYPTATDIDCFEFLIE